MNSILSHYSVHILLILWSIPIFTSCAENKSKTDLRDILAIEKEVLNIHDEVMPKMSDIARLTGVLETEAENSNLDSMLLKEIDKTLDELETGDRLMWDWMHNYNKPEEAPMDSIYAYLQKEKERVMKVREVMLASIQHAESLTQKLGHGTPN